MLVLIPTIVVITANKGFPVLWIHNAKIEGTSGQRQTYPIMEWNTALIHSATLDETLFLSVHRYVGIGIRTVSDKILRYY